MPKMTVPGYMLAAIETCKFVQTAMTVGADNSFDKLIDRWIVGNVPALFCVRGQMRPAIDRALINGHVKDYNVNRMMEIYAEKAKQYGCGNCGEQSALAFLHLRQKHVEPLDWVHFTHRDHAFVLLGHPRSGKGSNLKEWVDNVVVCDPYYNRQGPIATLPDYDLSKIASILHYEDGVTL